MLAGVVVVVLLLLLPVAVAVAVAVFITLPRAWCKQWCLVVAGGEVGAWVPDWLRRLLRSRWRSWMASGRTGLPPGPGQARQLPVLVHPSAPITAVSVGNPRVLGRTRSARTHSPPRRQHERPSGSNWLQVQRTLATKGTWRRTLVLAPLFLCNFWWTVAVYAFDTKAH